MERMKGDALVIEVKDKTTHAALLSWVSNNLELKEPVQNEVTTRRM